MQCDVNGAERREGGEIVLMVQVTVCVYKGRLRLHLTSKNEGVDCNEVATIALLWLGWS